MALPAASTEKCSNVLAAVGRNPLPELPRRPKPNHRIGEALGVVGNHGVILVDQIHPLGRDRGDHRGNAQRHALVDFPFDAGPEPKRRDRDPGSIEERSDVGHMAQELDARRVELQDLRRRIGADDLEHDVGQSVADQRENLPGKIEDSVDIGKVLEAADEDDVPATVESRDIDLFERIDGRQNSNIDSGAFLLEDRLLDRADDERQIGPHRQSKLLLLSAGDGGFERVVLLDAGLALFPQEMEVHGVEHDLGLRSESPDRRHVPGGGVEPGNDRQAEFATVLFQVVGDGKVVGLVDDLDTDGLQVSR